MTVHAGSGFFLAALDKRRKDCFSSRFPPFHELLLLWYLLPSITGVPVRYKPSKAVGESLDVVRTPLPSDVCSSEVWLSLSEGTIWPFSEEEWEIPAVDRSDGIYH